MTKKFILIFSVLIAIVIILVCVFVFSTTGNKSNTDDKNAIKETVETALRIRYGWVSKEKIKDIATENCQKSLKADGFYEGLTFYTINKQFMDSYHEEGPNTVSVSVEVYDPDIAFVIFTLTKTQDGKYIITDFGCDI